jgi:hypothetical protein
VNKKDGTTTKKQQQKLELQAERVVPWTELAPNDYNFRSWATARNQPLIRAGCVYEYARESRKLRCLLVLVKAAFKEARQAEQRQSRPPFAGLGFLSLSFEGLRYRDALLWLGGWFGWLRLFTDQLADNTSFADLREKNEKQVNDSLDKLPKFFLAPKAVEIALPNVSESLIEPRLLWPGQALDGAHRSSEKEVTMTVRIRRDYTNEQIGDEMARLAQVLRSAKEPEPERRGKGKRSELLSLLDALSAMRLASHYPKTEPSGLIRKQRRRRWRGTVTAVSIFNKIRLGRIPPGSTKRKILGEVGHNEFDRYAARGRKQFKDMFPFGETAANALTWAQWKARAL